MAHDDDQRHIQLRDRVFDAALDAGPRTAHHVAGHTHHKDIAHVAVHARARIGGEIGEPLRVHEGEGAHAGGNAEQAGEDDGEGRTLHTDIKATMTGPHAVSRMLPMAYGTV